MKNPLRIAISSQNFRTITGHAGKARRFLMFEVDTVTVRETSRLDLPIEMAMHGFDDSQIHPLDGTDILITSSSGDGFVHRMARRGVRVVATAETDPEIAIHAFLAGSLKSPAPHDHAAEEGHECGCHGHAH